MRNRPTSAYSGLTVILNHRSRNDKEEKLIDGWGVSNLFDSALLSAGFNHVHRASVEIRELSDIGEPFLAGTKCILALGEECVKHFLGDGITLGEQRGSPVKVNIDIENSMSQFNETPCIFSFAPQDAYDRFNYFDEDGDDDEDDTETAQQTKAHGKTRRKSWRFWLKSDIRKAVRLSQTGLKVCEPTYHLYPTAERVIELLLGARGQDLYFDIETEDNLQLTCFGFAFDDKDVYVVPMLQTHKGNSYYYNETDTCRILHALALAFLRNRIVAHNGAFDLFVMAWRFGLPLPASVFDTMLSHSRNFIEVERSLGHVISYYTDLPYHKNEGVYKPWNQQQADDLYRYNGKDVYALTQIKPAIEREAEKLKSSENIELVNRSLLPYMRSTLRGARVDWAAVNEIVSYNTKVMDAFQTVITTLCGFPLNPNSSQGKWSVKNYLYGKEGLGIKLPAKDPTNEKTLYSVLLKQDVAVIPWIIKFRERAKEGRWIEDGLGENKKTLYRIGGKMGFVGWEGSTVLNKFSEPRFTTQWKWSPVTFRRSSSKVRLFGGLHFGDNFQNFAKPLRKIIVADEGYTLMKFDQKGADAACVAWLARHGEYRELFLNNIKPHTFFAMHLFKSEWKKHFPPADIDRLCSLKVKALKVDPAWPAVDVFIRATDESSWTGWKYYFLAKKIIHGASYSMGPRTLRLSILQATEGTINLSNEEAKHYLDFLFKLFPEIKEMQKEVRDELRRYHMLRNMFGHPRVFSSFYPTSDDSDSQFREAYAYKPSSTVGQIIAYAVCELEERKNKGDELLIAADYQFLEDEHDALLCQVKDELVDEVAPSISKHIAREITNSRGESFKMGVDFSKGKRWDFPKEEKAPSK